MTTLESVMSLYLERLDHKLIDRKNKSIESIRITIDELEKKVVAIEEEITAIRKAAIVHRIITTKDGLKGYFGIEAKGFATPALFNVGVASPIRGFHVNNEGKVTIRELRINNSEIQSIEFIEAHPEVCDYI